MKKLILPLLLLAILIGACAPAAPAQNVTIRLAIIPVIDTLPMYVAAAEGFYEANGVSVEFIPVASAPDRDQLLQAAQADATLNESLSVMFFNQEKIQMQVVRYGHIASENAGHFFILASGASGITRPEQLKGIEIGVSQATIIEYVTERILQAAGLTADEIVTTSVPRIPDRMSLLASGQLQAGVMPDPLAALAVQQGSVIVLDDRSHPLYGASVISFRKEFVEQNPQAVRAFLVAIEQAVASINTNPEKYSGLLAEQKLVPEPLLAAYVIPPFPTAGVPSAAEWADALNWAKDKGYLKADIPYAESVTDQFLP
jgi:NitT/TauT family transport system substrate-binding protein